MDADQPVQSKGDKFFATFQHVDEEAEHVAAVDPDIAERVDHRNKWFEPGEFDAATQEMINQRSAQLLYNVMLYCSDGVHFDTYRGILRCAVRFICVMWVLAPDMLRIKKGSVATLQNMGDALGQSRCWWSMVAEDVSDCFGFISRNQKPLASRENYAAATKAAWEVRRKDMTAKKKPSKRIKSNRKSTRK